MFSYPNRFGWRHAGDELRRAAPLPGRSSLESDSPAAQRASALEAIDDNMACATLTAHGVSVSLEFRFNAAGEVVGIFTPGRWGSFGGYYVQKPWEGRFRDYVTFQGMTVPKHGEFGWYDNGVWGGSGKENFLKLN